MKKFFIWTVALIGMVFTACDGIDDGTKAIEFTDDTKPVQTFYADDTAGSVKFRAADAWTAEIVDATRAGIDWLTLSQYSGEAGECEINVTIEENATGEERKAEIRIICGDTVITVTVTQMPTKREENENPDNPEPAPDHEGMITIPEGELQERTAGANDTTVENFNFHATKEWKAIASDNWIIIVPDVGSAGDCQIGISLTPNTTGKERTAEIIITCGTCKYGLLVKQLAGEYVEPEPKPEPTPDPVPDNLLVSEIKVSGDNENYRLAFEYDDQYRCVKMTRLTRYDSDTDAVDIYNITYGNNTVSYKCDEDSGRITLDSNGRAVSGERNGYWYSYALSYNSNGYLSHSLLNGKDNGVQMEYTLTYSDSETRISYTNSNGKTDYDTATYRPIFVNSSNIDLNWLLGDSEALNWATGDCENIFAMLGYTGKRAFDMVDEVVAHAGDKTDPDYCIKRYEYRNGYDNFYMPVTEIIETNSHNTEIIKYEITYINK